jgi:hypothetical protein
MLDVVMADSADSSSSSTSSAAFLVPSPPARRGSPVPSTVGTGSEAASSSAGSSAARKPRRRPPRRAAGRERSILDDPEDRDSSSVVAPPIKMPATPSSVSSVFSPPLPPLSPVTEDSYKHNRNVHNAGMSSLDPVGLPCTLPPTPPYAVSTEATNYDPNTFDWASFIEMPSERDEQLNQGSVSAPPFPSYYQHAAGAPEISPAFSTFSFSDDYSSPVGAKGDDGRGGEHDGSSPSDYQTRKLSFMTYLLSPYSPEANTPQFAPRGPMPTVQAHAISAPPFDCGSLPSANKLREYQSNTPVFAPTASGRRRSPLPAHVAPPTPTSACPPFLRNAAAAAGGGRRPNGSGAAKLYEQIRRPQAVSGFPSSSKVFGPSPPSGDDTDNGGYCAEDRRGAGAVAEDVKASMGGGSKGGDSGGGGNSNKS